MSIHIGSFTLPPPAKRCVSIGSKCDAYGVGSICIGNNSKVNGVNSICIGNDNDVEGDNCVIVGNGKVIRGNNINSVDSAICIPEMVHASLPESLRLRL
jgi:hypothetical protein